MKFPGHHIFSLLSALISITSAFGQSPTEENRTSAGLVRRQYLTQSIGDEEIKLDGVHDEAAWLKVDWGTSFTQHQPDDGGLPYQETGFKILHNNKFLYLAYRVYDTSPDSIVKRLSRRDEFPGEWVEVHIDSYHDLRTAFSFTFSVSGVKGDEFVTEDGNNWDSNWNPVWEGVAKIDSLGWTAEIRIPFSQLRYSNQADPVWGLQVMRRVFRKEERSTWQHIPRTASGWVSQFGELHGLTNLPRNKQVELAPYVLAQTERFEEEPGNPFLDGSKSKFSVGIDGKLGVTRDMILDFTINPDFGQVEADPGSVRLDGYEIFFEERRPFFMESRNLFDYRVTGSSAGGDYDADLQFYSRRIGGAPHGNPSLVEGEFADIPTYTSILGAAKFSGKTKNGLSIGILESMTDPIKADIALGEIRREVLVEPLTNYFAGRLIQDYDGGNTIIGGMFTAVNRKDGIDHLNRGAYTGSFDFQHSWKNRWWSFKSNLIMSRLEGSKESILATQTNFVHLLQRTDADHLGVDPDRTSLTGTGGTIKVGKYSGVKDRRGGVYKFETGVTWRSPHLELNDVGFLLAADEINHFTWAGYHVEQPFSIFRNGSINYNHWGRWDFGGKLLYAAFNTNVHLWFNNNWMIGSGFTYNPYEVSNNALRGTTSLRKPAGYGYWFNVNSDSRKKIYYYGHFNYGGGFHKEVTALTVGGGVVIQPIDALSFSIEPGYGHYTRLKDQFVTNVYDDFGTRSIVSNLDQNDFSLSFRLNYYITPDLSIQYYGQPFIFRALYKDYGYVTKPLDENYHDRFHTYSSEEISIEDRVASIDEDHDGQNDYTFFTPDINFTQFRSNLVLRWEYVAGSEIFLVWSQDVAPETYNDFDTPLIKSLFENIADQTPHNIFLVKFSYRFLN